MSTRRVVLSSFVLFAIARVTCVVADDFPDKPVLGRSEPIGELLVLQVGFDDEPAPLPPAPIPQFELSPISLPPGLLLAAPPAATPDCFGTTRDAARIGPGEIPFHLSQAILGLTAAGLNEEAEQARSLLNEFRTKHQARLLLAAKQAQLSELQAEIHRLKLRVEKGITADRVSVSINIIEVDEGDGQRAFTGHPPLPKNDEPARHTPLVKMFDKGEFQELMTRIQDVKGVRILGSPRLSVLSGQQGQMTNGGTLLIPAIAQIGGPEEMTFGTTVTVTPTITDKDQIRLQFDVEHSELDEANGVTLNGTFVPGKTRRRARSTVDLKEGQTALFGGLCSTRNGQTTELVVTLTTEIVQPPLEISGPLAPPVEALQPAPTPPQSLIEKELTARVEPSQEEKQIMIETKIVSMATDRLKEFLDIPRHEEEELRGNGLSLVYSTIGSTADFKQKIKVGQKDGTIQINGAPNMRVSSGEPAQFIIGGQIDSTVVGADGTSKLAVLTFGTSVRGTATIVDGDRVRLRLIAERSSARGPKNDEDKPQIIGHQAASNVELSPGQTIVLGGDSDATHANQWLVLLSAEIINASDRPVKPPISTAPVTPAGNSESVPTP